MNWNIYYEFGNIDCPFHDKITIEAKDIIEAAQKALKEIGFDVFIYWIELEE